MGKTTSNVVGLVAVGLVAAGLGLLIGTLAAPASGRETRRRWRRRVEDEVGRIQQRGRRSVDGAARKVDGAVQKGVDYAAGQLQQGKDALTALVHD